jgi:dipeptidyl aminopeptidase/acylaminoacyl peptidase
VSADDPPVLILHGAADDTVPAKQAVEFDAALKAAGVDSTLVVLPTVGHRPGLDLGTPAGQALLSFLDRVLGAGVRPQHAPLP